MTTALHSPVVEIARWQTLSTLEQAAVRALTLRADQLDYAGPIERAVATTELDDPRDLAGLAIRHNRLIVGFLVLKRRSTAPAWAKPGAATISAMRIDQAHQGRGFGPAALVSLRSWVLANWPESDPITLSVDEGNLAAIRAYAKAGFIDHGLRRQGRVGWVRYMSMSLAQ